MTKEKMTVSELRANPKVYVLALAFAALAFVSACDNDSSKSTPSDSELCQGIDCSGNGTCAASDGKAICACNNGYHLDAGDQTKCVANGAAGNPCDGVTCDNLGVCAVKGGTEAVCLCNTGYKQAANNAKSCVLDDTYQKICGNIDCARDGGSGKCAVINNEPICACNAGSYLDYSDKTVCVPNDGKKDPCTEKSVDCGEGGFCAVRDGATPVCVCKEGYTQSSEGNTAKCVSTGSGDNPCVTQNVDCGSEGYCAVRDGTTPVCICNDGYHSSGQNPPKCVADTDWCEADAVDCGGNGRCYNTANGAVCVCDKDYYAPIDAPTECIKIASPCEGIDCDGHGSCLSDSMLVPKCQCDPNYLPSADGKHCLYNPCTGVSCAGGGTCVVSTGSTGTLTARCSCKSPYVNPSGDPKACVDYCGGTNDLCTKENGRDSDVNAKCRNTSTGARCNCTTANGYYESLSTETNPPTPKCVYGCADVTCNGQGTCSMVGSQPKCTCNPGYDNRLPTECIDVNVDVNQNHMRDYYETASDQGSDCSNMADRGKCSDFCDSFLDYTCSTKCTKNDQCMTGFICRSDGRCAAEAFVTTWGVKNIGNDVTFKFYNGSGSGCNYEIDWGDGSEKQKVTRCSQDKIEHIYKAAPWNSKAQSLPDYHEYRIKVTGTLNEWECFGECDTDNYFLTEIVSFGDVGFTSGNDAFMNARKLMSASKIDIPNSTKLTSMSFMFDEASSFDDAIENWDTSNVKNMSAAFAGASVFNHPLERWDTSKVTSMEKMFYNAKEFNQPIESWDTSKVENMGEMFYSALAFDQPLAKWNVSKVKDMNGMFFNAKVFNQDLNTWDTSNVESMYGMFKKAFKFDGKIDAWVTSKVQYMREMFYEAVAFNQAIGNWDTSNVIDMNKMFYTAVVFNQPLNKWKTGKVEDMGGMFYGATAFNQDINTNGDFWNVSKVTSMRQMFYSAKHFNQSLKDWVVNQITNKDNYYYMFGGGCALTPANWKSMRDSNEGWSSKDRQSLGLTENFD